MSSIRETEMNNSFTLSYLNPIVLFILMQFFFYCLREMLKIKNSPFRAGFKYGKWVNYLEACMSSTTAIADTKDPRQQWLLTENSHRVLHKERPKLVDGLGDWAPVSLNIGLNSVPKSSRSFYHLPKYTWIISDLLINSFEMWAEKEKEKWGTAGRLE